MIALITSACATTDRWRDEPITERPIAKLIEVPALRGPRTTDEALTAFPAERKAVAVRHAPQSGWPVDVQDVWLGLATTLEKGLAVGRPVDRRTLLRARVGTEVELDLTIAQFGPCPPAVAEHLGNVFGLIGHHIRLARGNERRPSFDWPVAPIIVTSSFGTRHDPLKPELRFHAGLDLGGSTGDVVIASGAGTVVHAGWMGGYGKAVVLQHTAGIETVYGHLRDVLVREGTAIQAGDAVGLMGSSGRSTGPHLHFEIRRDGEPIDPHDLIGLLAEEPRD